jgi:hypothetical protein
VREKKLCSLLFIVAWFRRKRRSSWHSKITNHSGASGSRASSIASRSEMATAACLVEIQILIVCEKGRIEHEKYMKPLDVSEL